MMLPASVQVTDVVARDGFQDEPRVLPTDGKLRVIEGLVRAGLRSIEATSFVHPRVVPQLADAEQVMARVPRRAGVAYSALVPNRKGAERALAVGVDEVRLVISASESHNRANLNRTVRESLDELTQTVDYLRSAAPQLTISTGIAAALGCAFEGFLPIERILWLAGELVALGIRAIYLADTNGMASPRQVRDVLTATRARFPEVTLGLHLHDARGMAQANVLAGLLEGVTRFDSSLGGIGGCPFTAGAAGNIATEDLVHMLHLMGIETGIDLDILLQEAGTLREVVGHDLQSRTAKAGKSTALHSLDTVKPASSKNFSRD